MKKVKVKSQTQLQVGDKFSPINGSIPLYEILEETAPRTFTVKRTLTGVVDKEQQIPHPSGDYPVWKFEEEE